MLRRWIFFAARGRSYRAMRAKEQSRRDPSSQNALLWMTAKGGFLLRIRRDWHIIGNFRG